MIAVTYTVTLLEPTLVTSGGGDPNSAVSHNYIPGSALRGAMIAKYLSEHGIKELDIEDSNIRRLFFSGATRYLNGYPAVKSDDEGIHRTLPVPASWHSLKDIEDKISDFVLQKPVIAPEEQWQPSKTQFWCRNQSDVFSAMPERNISVHTARTRSFGRAMAPLELQNLQNDETPGAVFRYDALAADQSFASAIICENQADAEEVHKLVSGSARLGRSRSAGYGLAEFSNAIIEADWQETSTDAAPLSDGTLSATLLSDAILIDSNGQYVPGFDSFLAALSSTLGIKLEKGAAFLQSTVIGGFNRKWGIPLPQAIGLRMGSIITFAAEHLDETALRKLESEGVGERRAEGFGRLSININREEELSVKRYSPEMQASKVSIEAGSPSEDLLKTMADRMLRKRLDDRLLERANGLDILNTPSNSQLSRLRNLISSELQRDKPSFEPIRKHLESIRERRVARNQFSRPRIANTPLLTWLKSVLNGEQGRDLETLLNMQSANSFSISNVQAELSDALRIEYTLRFLDAVLTRAVRKPQPGD